MLTPTGYAGLERGFDLTIRQFADVPCDKTRPEIAVGLQLSSGNTDNAGVAGQIDRIGNDGGGGIRLGRGSGQHRDGVGNAERETAPVTAAGGYAARSVTGIDNKRLHHARLVRPVHQTNRKLLALSQMQARYHRHC